MTAPARATIGDAWQAARAKHAPLAVVPAEGTDAPETFRAFVTRVKPRFVWYKHAEVLAAVLQRVADGDLTRVMVFEPVRHGKSELVSRLFPAYLLSRFPERWVGLASYGDVLARTLSRAARNNFVLGGGALAGDSAATDHWETRERGGMWSAGVGGGITGKGGHFLIIDDPVKADVSDTVHDAQLEWYDSTFSTRAEPDAAIVLTMTRWAPNDLAGRLLARETPNDDADEDAAPERWHIVNLPALAETDPPEFPETCTVEPDWRAPGEALCPERYPEPVLQRRRAKNARVWLSLYQQRPAAPGGIIFKREQINYWCHPGRMLPPPKTSPRAKVVELPPVFQRQIQSWDFTFKGEKGKTENQGSAFNVGYHIAATGAARYVLDERRDQWDFVETVREVVRLRADYTQGSSAPGVYYEDKANGPAIKSALRSSITGLVAVDVDGDKEARAWAVQPQFAAGDVYLPHPDQCAWTEACIAELIAFPRAKRKDRPDALSQGLRVLEGTTRGGWDAMAGALTDPVGTAAIVGRSKW